MTSITRLTGVVAVTRTVKTILPSIVLLKLWQIIFYCILKNVTDVVHLIFLIFDLFLMLSTFHLTYLFWNQNIYRTYFNFTLTVNWIHFYDFCFSLI